MSDLQCPATFHVFGPEVEPPRLDLVHGAPIVAVHAHDSRTPDPARGAAESVPLPDGESLDVTLVHLSDLYRGVHVVVLPAGVQPPLTGVRDEVVVRVDADGRSVEHVAVR